MIHTHPNPIRARATAALVVAMLLSTAQAQDLSSTAITPWPGVTIPNGVITSIDSQELVVRPHDPADPISRFGWHQIQSTDDSLREHDEAARVGRAIWRSALRLDRGDWHTALSMLEELRPTLHRTKGPTTIAFYRQLMRARLGGMDRAGAVDAWLFLIAAGASDEPVHPELAPIYIQSYQYLLPSNGGLTIGQSHSLATNWSPLGPASESLDQEPDADDLFNALSPDDADSRLHVLCVAAYLGSKDTRQSARDELDPLATSDDTFRGAWARYAVGRSLTLEESPYRVRLGIAQLLEVSIRDNRTTPILAGMALAEAAIVAARLEDSHAARVLAAEFRRRFPAHPAHVFLPTLIEQPDSPSETETPS